MPELDQDLCDVEVPDRRETTGSERRTAQIELLWDLVFVFAVTQVTTLVSDDLSWSGFGRAMLALALVWWAWSAFTWAANAHDPEARSFRLAMFVATASIFIVGLALPGAFGRDGVLFAVAYAGVRFVHLAIYADASRQGRASLSAIAGFAATVTLGMALLVAGSISHHSLRIALWVAAAAIDYAGPAWLTRKRLRTLQRVAVAHFAERYSLFVIICLGESIVEIGVGASAHSLSGATVAVVLLVSAITVGLWWTYFDRFAARAEARLRAHRDPVLAAADGYSYMHLVLVAGILLFAVGARHAVTDVSAPLTAAPRLTLCGGVALYLVGHVAFLARLLGIVHLVELATAGATMVLFLASSGMPAWATVACLAFVVSLLVAAEIRPDLAADA